MKINSQIQLDYSDVLIHPLQSSLTTRKDVNIVRDFYFPLSRQKWSGVPIMCANMDTVGTYEVYKVLSQHKMITCFHKFYTTDDYLKMDLNPDYFCITIGLNEIEKLQEICNTIEVKFICIDVANGYMDKLIEVCREVRKLFPNKILIAGNVVCRRKTQELIKKGKVDIVKVGIGSGCFDKNTNILMANGTYKKIKDVKKDDYVINKDGKPVKVLQKFYKGQKEFITVKSNCFHDNTHVTSDHLYWVGNLDHLSMITIKKSCVSKIIGNTHFEWKPIDDVKKDYHFNLLPKNIEWTCKEKISIDMIQFKTAQQEYDETTIYINDKRFHRYIELDEKIGNMIGSYFYHQDKIEKVKNYIHQFDIDNEMHYHESLIRKFLQSLGTSYPASYYCTDKGYLKGLYKGLLNLNEDEFSQEKHSYQIHSKFIEVVYFCIMNLGFSYRVNANNTKITIFKKSNHELYEIHTLKKIKNTSKIIDCYDLEIDSPCHSFIANNSIVHNSACLTRSQTGVGVPQLSAIDSSATGAHDVNGFVIGDGGITCPGDISKGLGAGADFIMIGGLFGGHDENPGDVIEKNGTKCKQFYGMSSNKAMDTHYGKMDNYRSSEGRVLEIPYKGKLNDTIEDFLGGIRSTCTYVGAKNIEELPERCHFIRVNNQLNKIYEKF